MSWKKVKLGKLVENFSVRAKDVGGAEGLDFYGVSNENGIIKTKYAAEDKAEDYKIIERDCFAYNPYRVNVGSIGMVADNIRGLISPAYVIFKPKPNVIKPELLFKFLKSSEGIRQIKFFARGTVRQALRFEDLCNIELSIPSYEQQEILFEKLNKIHLGSDLLSSELTHQLSLVKKLRQQLLQDAVQGKLVVQNKKDEPANGLLKKIKAEKEKLIKAGKLKKEKELTAIKEEEIPFEIPESWVWCRLGEVAANIEYGTSQKAEMSSDHIPVLRMNNIQDGKIDYEKLKYIQSSIDDLPKLYLKEGDLLFNRTNSYELVGKSGVYHGGHDVMTFASYLIRVQFSKNISTDFVNHYINSSFCRKTQLEPEIIQQNGQANFNGTKLKNIICPLPPLAEQNRIVQKLDELMQYCNELEASIKESALQNEKLLQQVLREALRKE